MADTSLAGRTRDALAQIVRADVCLQKGDWSGYEIALELARKQINQTVFEFRHARCFGKLPT